MADALAFLMRYGPVMAPESLSFDSNTSLLIEDAAKRHAVCFALDKSTEEGRPVKLSEFLLE